MIAVVLFYLEDGPYLTYSVYQPWVFTYFE